MRVVSVPASIARMPRASKRAFARAVGRTFQIEAFDESGCAELDLTGKVGFDTIWIEPFCVRRVRRPRQHSLRFRRILEIRRKLDRPRWSFRYVAKYHKTDDPAKLIKHRQRFETNQGWYVLERRREIHGTFYAGQGPRRAGGRGFGRRDAVVAAAIAKARSVGGPKSECHTCMAQWSV